MRIQVLGPVRIWHDGQALEGGPPAQRALLGLLALDRGRPLSRDELLAGVWYGRRPPASAANVLQTYVKRLRRLLEPDRAGHAAGTVLSRVGDGYVLDLPADDVDVAAFQRLVRTAGEIRRSGEPDAAAVLLRDALDLWTGAPLADVPHLADHPRVAGLSAQRQDALGAYGEAMLAADRAGEAVDVLEEVARSRPFDEVAQARLIRAYHATGRRDRAFRAYHVTRRRLSGELGVSPGPELTAVHRTLLEEAPEGPPASVVLTRTPAQLPADVPDFTGRETALDDLDALTGAGAVGVISGTAGVGKTSLAVHWAHRAADRFPDGHLYVDLRGFDDSGAVADPHEVLRRCIEALGVPADRIPADPEARTALYRSELYRRRVLVLLDNARDSAQVRPLLPGGPGCVVVVTSRNRLADLVAVEGARPVAVPPMSDADARRLLTLRVGAARAAAEPQALDYIVEKCAGLPLALTIASARVATSVTLSLGTLAAQLGDGRDGGSLDALSTGEPAADLRTVFSWSYAALSEGAARLFRGLGLHPGPDCSLVSAAAAAGLPTAGAKAAAAELGQANLVQERAGDRYGLHDLVRAFAADTAHRIDPPPRRRAVTHLIVDHYLHTAYRADALISGKLRFPPVRPVAGARPEHFTGTTEALAWFRADHAVLLGIVDLAAAERLDAQCWQLGVCLGAYLDRGGHWHELAAVEQTALRAAGRAGDHVGRAVAHRMLARAYTRLNRFDQAQTELSEALSVGRALGDRTDQSLSHLALSLVMERRGRPDQAYHHARRALDLVEAGGDRSVRARALSAVGWYLTLRDEHREAIDLSTRALADLTDLGDLNGQANTWESLANAHRHLGEYAEAVECYRRAVRLYGEIGDRHLVGITLIRSGDNHEDHGRHEAARTAWTEAVTALDGLGVRDIDDARTRLARTR
ncbi:BTAD domain-containing putative transcriptional regulator [Actinoplanes sp. NPDC049265]|uniref:AfsR/SARP family transcriptional regulator n=1 Tax=Actinoplanes sp. NPDC049265 TaxID=3363902 RepID=UPI003724B529